MRSERETPRTVLKASSTTSDRTTSDRTWPWRRQLDRRQSEREQHGRSFDFLRQPAYAGPDGKAAKRGPRGHQRKRDRQRRPGREKQRVGNGRRLHDRKYRQRGDPKQRVRPQGLQRQHEPHHMII